MSRTAIAFLVCFLRGARRRRPVRTLEEEDVLYELSKRKK